jgi:predicted O-methyltransferase YrrM
LLRGESATFVPPASFLKNFDVIYIDASHSDSAVKSDSENAFRMLKDSGIIIWDDYCYPGIWKYLNELAARRPDLNLRYIYDWDKVMMLPR